MRDLIPKGGSYLGFARERGILLTDKETPLNSLYSTDCMNEQKRKEKKNKEKELVFFYLNK